MRSIGTSFGFPDRDGTAPSLPEPPRLALGPFCIAELGWEARGRHWLRGGYPEAFTAASDETALAWLGGYIDGLAEKRLVSSGFPWAPMRTRRFLSMLAGAHGSCLNENAVARSLGLSRPTVARAVAALKRAGILRGLAAVAPPDGRRAVRSEILYFRDPGLLHALLGLRGNDDLMGSPGLAASWEGYAVEQAMAMLPAGIGAGHYRSKDGAALELVFHGAEGRLLGAAAIRWARPGKAVPRGALNAAAALGSRRNWLVLPEAEEARLADGFTVLGLRRFLELVSGF